MTKLFEPLALGTNIFKGYPLEEALTNIKSAGFEYAEIASIANMCEHVAPKDMNDALAEKIKQLLAQAGLKTYALAGHVDLTDESDLNDFLKKVEFAAAIGAKIVNTNSGPLERLHVFRSNIRKIIDKAEKYNIQIGLESHGDIIGTAKESIKYLREINHPLIRFNYDTGNTYFYAKGRVKVEEDIKYCLEYMDHIHLKDIMIRGNQVNYCAIGEGDLDFSAIFNSIKSVGKPIAASLEIPVFVSGTLEALSPANAPLQLDKAMLAINDSKDHIDMLLTSI